MSHPPIRRLRLPASYYRTRKTIGGGETVDYESPAIDPTGEAVAYVTDGRRFGLEYAGEEVAWLANDLLSAFGEAALDREALAHATFTIRRPGCTAWATGIHAIELARQFEAAEDFVRGHVVIVETGPLRGAVLPGRAVIEALGDEAAPEIEVIGLGAEDWTLDEDREWHRYGAVRVRVDGVEYAVGAAVGVPECLIATAKAAGGDTHAPYLCAWYVDRSDWSSAPRTDSGARDGIAPELAADVLAAIIDTAPRLWREYREEVGG